MSGGFGFVGFCVYISIQQSSKAVGAFHCKLRSYLKSRMQGHAHNLEKEAVSLLVLI